MKGAGVCSLSKSDLTLHELSFLESQGRRNLWHLPDGGLEEACSRQKKVYTKEVDTKKRRGRSEQQKEATAVPYLTYCTQIHSIYK